MNRKLMSRLLALTAIFIIILTSTASTVKSVPPIPQKTWIVDVNGNGDFTKIQDAINNSKGGDTIVIKAGIYYENNINVNKMVTIQGQGSSDTIINCSGKRGFVLNTSSVAISDLKIVDSIEYGIYVSQGSTRCTISNIFIGQTTYIGIYVHAPETKIINCDIRGASLMYGNGILLRDYENIVKDCNIQGFSIAVFILLNSDNNMITNCNLFNNGEAIDIRIDSGGNIITECNIYANDQGIAISQNSNNNQIYLNNFWKNKIDASAEGINKWDNNSQGNYWDDYTGTDANHDGVGDTPYKISEGNVDNYPITSLILPEGITPPTSVTCITSISDNTPSFTWVPSLSNKGIKGYYVKIDDRPETFIGDTTNWTSTSNISDGAHIFYVRGETIDNTSSRYGTLLFYIYTPTNASLIDSDNDGLPDVVENQLGSSPENPHDVRKIYLDGKPYFLVDVNQDGTFDVLYNSATKTTTAIEKSGERYFIDTNGDGKWDYIYDTSTGAVSKYEEEQISLTLTIWIGIIIAIIVTAILIFYYIRKRPMRPVVTRRIIKKPVATEKTEKIETIPTTKTEPVADKKEMIDETSTLLKLIHQDFTIYMDRLQQITEQIASAQQKEKKKEEEIKPPAKKKHPRTRDIEDIEFEIDNLLSTDEKSEIDEKNKDVEKSDAK